VCSCGEIIPRALHGVSVTVTFRARHAHRARSQQFVHGHAVAIDTDARPLGLGDLQQVHAHASDAHRLRRDRAFRCRGDLLQIKQVDTHQEAGGHQERDKNLHTEIVRAMNAGCNRAVPERAEGNNTALSAAAPSMRLLDSHLPPNPLPRCNFTFA